MLRITGLIGLLVVSLLALTIFGAPQAAHASAHGATCLVTIMTGAPAPCPERDLLGFINFHLNAFKNFSRALTDLASTLALVVIFLVVLATAPVFKPTLSSLGFLNLNNFSLASLTPNFTRWLSFHENSPDSL